jgi:transcription antitermination factor NusG
MTASRRDNSVPDRQSPQWYACYTRARHEKKVARVLGERGVEHYLPLLECERQWADRRKLVELPLFPSYLFARVALDDIASVLSVPGVVGVVRNLGQPIAVCEADLQNVRRFVAALASTPDAAPEPMPLPAEGAAVRVISGPFAGVAGVVLEHRGRARVLVGLSAVGMGMAVDVSAEMLAEQE